MINLFFQCMSCMAEIPKGVSPEEYSDLQVGLTEDNEELQVWCRRHDCNVMKMPLDEEQKKKFNVYVCEVCGCRHPPNHQH